MNNDRWENNKSLMKTRYCPRCYLVNFRITVYYNMLASRVDIRTFCISIGT